MTLLVAFLAGAAVYAVLDGVGNRQLVVLVFAGVLLATYGLEVLLVAVARAQGRREEYRRRHQAQRIREVGL